MRKLASVKRVSTIKPHPGADRLDIAVVDGWNVIVRKGEVSPGELVVMFEIDSFLPVEPRYEFLRSSSYKRRGEFGDGFRLRSVKLRGELSQGLVMPLSSFEPELAGMEIDEGNDLTSRLGITLYEPPVPVEQEGTVKGDFPSFLRKSDQERVQNLPWIFAAHRDLAFEMTEKIDGTSATYYVMDGAFGACKRNFELEETGDNVFWMVARDLDLETTLRSLDRNIAIQGEIAGEKIAGNPLVLHGHDLFTFDIFDIDARRYLLPGERTAVFGELQARCEKLRHVPVVDPCIEVLARHPSVGRLLRLATGPSAVTPGVAREGLVFKSTTLVNGQMLSFKAVSNEYLLSRGQDPDA